MPASALNAELLPSAAKAAEWFESADKAFELFASEENALGLADIAAKADRFDCICDSALELSLPWPASEAAADAALNACADSTAFENAWLFLDSAANAAWFAASALIADEFAAKAALLAVSAWNAAW